MLATKTLNKSEIINNIETQENRNFKEYINVFFLSGWDQGDPVFLFRAHLQSPRGRIAQPRPPIGPTPSDWGRHGSHWGHRHGKELLNIH